MKIFRFLMIVISVMCFTTGAYAKGYPDKPVKVVVPFTAGSATDVIARIVTDKLAEMWKQPVVVENVAGAGGSFVYIAASDLIPESHRSRGFSASMALCGGVLIAWLAGQLVH